MDALDYQILEVLEENARENATNIGAKINLSTSAVIERILLFQLTSMRFVCFRMKRTSFLYNQTV